MATRSCASWACRLAAQVGRAYQYLLDLRMEHGPLGPERATQELRDWAEAEGLGSPPDAGRQRLTARPGRQPAGQPVRRRGDRVPTATTR